MTPQEVSMTIGLITLALTLSGLIWHAATMAQQLRELRAWREKHEPTAVEIAKLDAAIHAQGQQLDSIRVDIQRLYDRKPTRGQSS